jgi:hypothetical protein
MRITRQFEKSYGAPWKRCALPLPGPLPLGEGEPFGVFRMNHAPVLEITNGAGDFGVKPTCSCYWKMRNC